VTHDHKNCSLILVHTIYLLTVPVYQPMNGISHHQHNCWYQFVSLLYSNTFHTINTTVGINLSHYSIATHFNLITFILRLNISTKMYTYYGCTKLFAHWNAISSPQVLHILLSFIGFVKKYFLMSIFFLMQCVVQLRK